MKNVLETLGTDITFFFQNSFLQRQVDEDKRDVRAKRAREICRRKLFETSKSKRYFTEKETSYNSYLKDIEMREEHTTKRSSKLNADRQNAPSCIIKPNEIIFKQISIVNTVVKK